MFIKIAITQLIMGLSGGEGGVGGGGGGVVPMSDVNFDKNPSCRSWQVLNMNRGRMADRTCSIRY